MALPPPTYHVRATIEREGKRCGIQLSGPFQTEAAAQADQQKQRMLYSDCKVWKEQSLIDDEEED